MIRRRRASLCFFKKRRLSRARRRRRTLQHPRMRLRVLHHRPIVSRQRTERHLRLHILLHRLAHDLRRRQRALGDDVESREFRPLRLLFPSLRRASRPDRAGTIHGQSSHRASPRTPSSSAASPRAFAHSRAPWLELSSVTSPRRAASLTRSSSRPVARARPSTS